VHALQQQWAASGASYRSCAALSHDPQTRAQALYCVGVACHQQGAFQDALNAYQAAAAAGPPDSLRAMLALGSARALQGMGRADEAAATAATFLAQGRQAGACPPPVADALQQLAASSAGKQQ
jgi:tetratricopeptide (TPR) repeat protein